MAKTATATDKVRTKPPVPPSFKMPDIAAGNAKAALSAIDAGKSAMQMIHPDQIRVIPGFNVRANDTEDYRNGIQELKRSILKEGYYLTKPLAGYVGKDGEADVIFLTDGHRRLEAVRQANTEGAEVTSVPVILKDPKTSMVDLTVALVKENTGKRLSMLENAVIIKRLLKSGLDEDEIAERLDFSKKWIGECLTLIASSKQVREWLKQGKITGTEALRILRKYKDAKEAEDKIGEMIEKAERRGKAKATRADSGDAPVKASRKNSKTEGDDNEAGEAATPKQRMRTDKVEWVVTAGQSFDLKEIRHFKGLIPDTDWYILDENKAGWATATEDLQFAATIKRPKKEEAPEAKEEAEGDETEGEGEGESDEAEAEETENDGTEEQEGEGEDHSEL